MALIPGESWVTVAYADNYFDRKYNTTFWAGLTTIEKEQLLVTAKNFILQLGYNIADSNTTTKVKRAQCETAQFIYEFYESWRKRCNLIASGVKNFKVINFSEALGKAELPEYIKHNLQDYKTNSGNYIGVLERDINDY